jgi:hypothetical protein
MNLVSVEAPAARVALARKPLELLDTSFGIVAARQRLQIVPNQLIEALAEDFRLPSGTSYELLVDGEGDIHLHSIRGHWLCVNGSFLRDLFPFIGLTPDLRPGLSYTAPSGLSWVVRSASFPWLRWRALHFGVESTGGREVKIPSLTQSGTVDGDG